MINGEIELKFTIKHQTKSLPERKSLFVSENLFFPSLVTYKCDLGYVLMASLFFFLWLVLLGEILSLLQKFLLFSYILATQVFK